MKKVLSTTLLTLGVCLSPFSIAAEAADSRVAHYQAAQADSVEATLRNLRDANRKLTELLAGDVTDHDIHDIHTLSYTLEDSLQRLLKELRSLHDTVADMHWQSEGLKREAVIDYGQAYLDGFGKVFQ